MVGAGPAGLATAACLQREGVDFRLVDRSGEPGGAYRKLYDKIMLASPARYCALPGLAIGTKSEYISVAHYRDYLERYAQSLTIERAEVTAITREQLVVVCTGMVDFPYTPDIPGLQATHARDWRGPVGEKLLVLGGGASAVEIAEEAGRAGVRCVLSTRTGKLSLSPQRLLGLDIHHFAFALWWLPRLRSYCERPPTFTGNDQGIGRLREQGVVRVRGPVVRCEGRRADFADGQPEEFDQVVAATGYRWEMPFLPTEVTGGGIPRANEGRSVVWPNLYFVGVHCCRGVSSQFLRGIALDAPVVARRLRERTRL